MKKPKLFSPPRTSGANKFAKESRYKKISWVEYRSVFLKHNPNCYACPERARVVDHIIAHKDNETLFWATTNFMPLCKSCHDTITANFDRYNPPKTEEKMKWVDASRYKHSITTRVKIVPR